MLKQLRLKCDCIGRRLRLTREEGFHELCRTGPNFVHKIILHLCER